MTRDDEANANALTRTLCIVTLTVAFYRPYTPNVSSPRQTEGDGPVPVPYERVITYPCEGFCVTDLMALVVLATALTFITTGEKLHKYLICAMGMTIGTFAGLFYCAQLGIEEDKPKWSVSLAAGLALWIAVMFVESIVFNSLAMAIGGGVTMVGYSIVIQYIPPQPDYYMFITIGVGVVVGYFCSNIVKAAAENAFISLIIFALIFAFAMTRIDAKGRALLTAFFTAVRDAMLVVIEWILWIAPVGVSALALVVGARAGTGAFGALVHYILIVAGVGVIVSLAAYPIAVFGGRVRIGDYARAALPSQAVAISTQSSIASLPSMVEGASALGVPVATSGITLPLAVAIFRATGPAMNLAVAIYVAFWFGVPLSPAVLAVGVVVATLTSLGSVSLPGTISYVSAIAPITAAIGAPVAPLGLLVAVETIPDIIRTLGNVMMDLATTVTLSRRNGGRDSEG